jgi:hypothetical protein
MSKHETVGNALETELIPLNIAGAFTSPAISANFDLGTATPAELARYGLPSGRPRDPESAAVWARIFARPWLAKNRIVPILEVREGKTHVLRGPKKHAMGSAGPVAFENNWAGGVLLFTKGAPNAVAISKLDGYEFNHQQHVNYVGIDNHCEHRREKGLILPT